MSNRITAIAASAFLTLALVLPASAQGATFDMTSLVAAGSGSQGNTTSPTLSGTANAPPGLKTGYTHKNKPHKLLQYLPVVSAKGLAPVFGLVGYGSLGGFGAGGPAVSPQDYVDSPNQTDTNADLAAQQTILNWEQANNAQDMANAAAQGYGSGNATGYGPGNAVGSGLGNAVGSGLGNAIGNSLGNAISNWTGF